jgi:hypothetical protein
MIFPGIRGTASTPDARVCAARIAVLPASRREEQAAGNECDCGKRNKREAGSRSAKSEAAKIRLENPIDPVASDP